MKPLFSHLVCNNLPNYSNKCILLFSLFTRRETYGRSLSCYIFSCHLRYIKLLRSVNFSDGGNLNAKINLTTFFWIIYVDETWCSQTGISVVILFQASAAIILLNVAYYVYRKHYCKVICNITTNLQITNFVNAEL